MALTREKFAIWRSHGKVRQMAMTWESFPDGGFKYKSSSEYGTTTFALDIHAIFVTVFDYSLLLNVCSFNAADILPLEPKG
jgi:hypothetical protein